MEVLRNQMDILQKQYTKADLVQIRQNKVKEHDEAKHKHIDNYVAKNIVPIILENAAIGWTRRGITHHEYSKGSIDYPIDETVVERLKLRFPDSEITLERDGQSDLVIVVDWS
jgi:hypothetical protein